MENFYHTEPIGKPLDTSDAQLGVGIGIFALVLVGAIVLVPKIMNRR